GIRDYKVTGVQTCALPISQYEYHFAQVQLVCFMLAMGLTLAPADFVEIVRRPRSFLAGLFGQLFVVPWLAVLVNAVAGFEDGLRSEERRVGKECRSRGSRA